MKRAKWRNPAALGSRDANSREGHPRQHVGTVAPSRTERESIGRPRSSCPRMRVSTTFAATKEVVDTRIRGMTVFF